MSATAERPRLRLTPLTPKQAAKLTRPKEVQVQCGYAAWCRRLAGVKPELARGFHVPNGEERDIRVARKLAAMGVRAGVLDWCLPVPRGGFHGLFLEFKRPGEKPSEEQWHELDCLRADGYCVAVFDDWLKAAEWTLAYLDGRLQRDVLHGADQALREVEAQLQEAQR
jgi:hypothetical protein